MTTAAPVAPMPVRSAPAPSEGPSRQELLEGSRKLQELVEQAEQLRDPVARALVHECLHSLLSFYGDGLTRVLQVVQECGPEGKKVLDRLVNDPVLRGLLLIHGLYPQSLETRLHQAIERIRPYMESHGGNVELLSLENDFARFQLKGACETCPSSSITMELALRHALEELCPDLVGFEVEGVAKPSGDSSAQTRQRPGTRAWTSLEGVQELPEGGAVALEVKKEPLVVCRSKGRLYAYRNQCPGCGSSLETGAVPAGELRCAQGHRYDLRQAGRDLQGSERHLEPVPLLVEEGSVKVALG